MNRFRQFILGANLQGQKREFGREIRKGVIGLAHRLRRTTNFAADLEAFQDRIDLHHSETGSWIGPKEIQTRVGGPFDARELRVYLQLALNAGVPVVEAREILHLNEEELGIMSGPISLPDNVVTRSSQALLRKRLSEIHGTPDMGQGPNVDPLTKADSEDETSDGLEAEGKMSVQDIYADVLERSMKAMDDIPEGWMVRSNLCGPSTLKALAGCGIAGQEAPEVRFGSDLEIGPGWIRNGNRRRIDLTDHRIVSSAAQGAKDDSHVFVARPWVEAARYLTCDDPHRSDTPAAGKGTWPAEWRAFVEGGKVRGVSFYYSWAGEATPENARIAIEVRRLAQLVANEAVAIGAWPRSMDIEFLRADPRASEDQKARILLDRFPREGVAFTLDFMETKEGLKVLEGGPAHTPLGMGHSCGFTGMIDPVFGNCMLVDGVAFRTLPGINLIDTDTWKKAGDRAGCILTWDETISLASA